MALPPQKAHQLFEGHADIPLSLSSCIKKLEDGLHSCGVPENLPAAEGSLVPRSGIAKHQSPGGEQRPDSAGKMLTDW